MGNVNGIEQVMLLLSQQGPAMVITGVVIYFILKLGNLGFEYLKNKITAKGEGKRTDISLKIQILLDRILGDAGAKRVLIFEFHNGTANLHDVPFQFMTCSYEAHKKEITGVGGSLKGIPVTLYAHFFNALQKNPYLILDSEKPDYQTIKSGYDLLTFQDETKALFMILRDVKDKPIGFMAVFKPDGFSDDNIRPAADNIGRLGNLLSTM